MRRIFILVLAIATLMTASVSFAVASPPDHAARPEKAANPDKPTKPERGPAEKVDVCHYSSGEKGFHLINVSGNALEAHLAHGDTQPGDVVPDMENYEYGTDCEIRSTQVVDGSYSDSGQAISFSAFVSFEQVVSGTGVYTSYTGGGNIMTMASVTDVCLDEVEGTATVWGPSTSSNWADGYVVLTLVDDGGSVSSNALFYEAGPDAEAAFASQCAAPVTPYSSGGGTLIFG